MMTDKQMTAREKAVLIERARNMVRSGGPHEWGYRDLADGTFIADPFPFQAAQVLADMTPEPARRHALTRASPKGGPFIGTCFQCGTPDLPAQAVSWPCENVANISEDEALMHAITDGPAKDQSDD